MRFQTKSSIDCASVKRYQTFLTFLDPAYTWYLFCWSLCLDNNFNLHWIKTDSKRIPATKLRKPLHIETLKNVDELSLVNSEKMYHQIDQYLYFNKEGTIFKIWYWPT